jgi:hypothetical protein
MIHMRFRPRAVATAAACALLLSATGTHAQSAAPSRVDPGVGRAELQWAADTLLNVHPALTRQAARTALEQSLATQQARLGDAPTRGDVAIALQLLLASLGDPHTSSAPQAASAHVLPVVFFSVSDAVLVSPVSGFDTGLPDVARLVRLGGLSPTQLLSRLHELVPGNDAWVRYRLGQFVNAEDVLRWLGVLEDGRVRITVAKADGTTVDASVRLAPAADLAHRGAPLQARLQRAAGMTEAWTGRGKTFLWRIDEASGTGVFWLLSCVDSPDYRAAVDAFFSAVHDAGASRVVLDLRFDGGGNSNVAAAFLGHLPARSVHSYGVEVRPSDALSAQRGSDPAALSAAAVAHDGDLLVMQQPGVTLSVPAKPPIFHGDVVVLVNGATFSSAGMVAVMLHDNALASIAGSPMGADPNGYGDILSFQTPALDLPFTVSYKRFERPDRDMARPDTLTIDTPLALTAGDILTGRDELATYLRGERH